MRRHRKVDECRGAPTRRLATFAARAPHLHGISEKLRVEIEANRRNVPRLFATEQVARAANLKIRERQLKSGAEVRCVKNRLEALARIIGERLFPSIEEIAPGATTAAADAATQLIELRETESIGAINDDRVRIRNVETRFNDGGTDQDLRLAANKLAHDALQCALLHLPVPNDHSRIRNESAKLLRRRLNRFNAVMHVVRLAAALQFAQQRVAYQFKTRLGDARCHGVAILGWGLDRGEVANPREGKVQRARDRRGGEGHHVEFGAKRLHALLGGNAETVLLINHEEAEVLEGDVLRKKSVGGND